MAASSVATVAAFSSVASKSNNLSVGALPLKTKVIEAARQDLSNTIDLNGIAWMEHLNLVVGKKDLAEKFYFDFLGMTKDPDARFHANLGQQQFHLAETGDSAQRIVGSIGLVVPTLDTLRKRLPNATEALKGTQFKVVEDEEEYMTVVCPWGNVFHIYHLKDDMKDCPSRADSPHKMVNLHSDGGAYGVDRMAVRGKPGIRYVEITTCRNVQKIAHFYKELLGCTVSTLSDSQVAICVGPNVHLLFNENPDFPEEEAEAMKGVHVCVYVHDFKGLYERLQERGLVWTNPRFLHLDSCDTWSDALLSRTLRFKDIIDLETGETILELEHETRPMRHGQYLKVPKYDAK